MPSDHVQLSSAEARVEEIKGGSVGVGEGIPAGFHAHCPLGPLGFVGALAEASSQHRILGPLGVNLVLWCFVLNPSEPHAYLTTRWRLERNTNELCSRTH